MINAVNEAHSDLGMVVGHEDDVKQLLAVRVELPQSVVDVHQRLRESMWRLGLDKQTEGCASACQRKVTMQLLLHHYHDTQTTRNHKNYTACPFIY